MDSFKRLFLGALAITGLVLNALTATILFTMTGWPIGIVQPHALGWFFVVNALGWLVTLMVLYHSEEETSNDRKELV